MPNLDIDALIAADIQYMSAGLGQDGFRPAGSEFANQVGFTSERFDGYLWEDKDTCYLSLVISKQPGQGHLSEVLSALTKLGYTVKVPNPIGTMQNILIKKGFAPSQEDPSMWIQTPTPQSL